MYNALLKTSHRAEFVWHKTADLSEYDLVVLPGGFSYGDYLRAGAVARFSKIMQAVVDFAKKGRPVLGICNGFQILVETGLLPGALMRNENLRFICRQVYLRTENPNTMFTRSLSNEKPLKIPIAHGEGRYFIDREDLKALQDKNRIVFRYVNEANETLPEANPNGSIDNIAGIINSEGNVLGMMPHPERAIETLLGSSDGRLIFESLKAS
jgi:phosphoribosylformylglycinamidine synthase